MRSVPHGAWHQLCAAHKVPGTMFVQSENASIEDGSETLSLPTCRTELFGDCGIESAFVVRSCGIFVL